MGKARIIAVETSSRVGSVALALDSTLLAQREFSTQTQHARELLPTLAELYAEQDWPAGEVDACYLSIGPGSFTGLRVAVTVARHLALARGAKIVAVPTLAVIAANALQMSSCDESKTASPLVVVLDAKRGQVFAGAFEHEAGRYHAIVEPCLADPLEFLAQFGGKVWVTGEGVDFHQDAMSRSGARVIDRSLWTPRASSVHAIGWRMALEGRFTPPRELTPFYLRRPEAEEIWEKRHGGSGAADSSGPAHVS